jgi:hypothetical protein
MADKSDQAKPSKPLWKDKSLGVVFPPKGTGSLCEFAVSFIKIQSFLVYILDYVTGHATLDNFIRTLDFLPQELLASSPADDAYKIFGNHRQFLFEVMLSRHVDNYLCFLSSILKECLLAKPEAMLSSDKNIPLKTVLSHESKKSLVQTVVEEMVQSLAYGSFGDLAKFFRKNFKIEIANESQTKTITEAIEVRNISIHNRCIIDKKYCSKTGTKQAKVGCIKTLSFDYLAEIANALASSAIHSDSALSAKFSLEIISIESSDAETEI